MTEKEQVNARVENLFDRLIQLPVDHQTMILSDLETALENRIKVFEKITV